MGSKERRERERVDTRQRILDAARDMFVQHGYDETTMRAIADRIEYTATAIYHHFPSKEALLNELCAADFYALAQVFQRIGKVEDPIERVRRIGQSYVQFAMEYPMHYQLMFMSQRPAPAEKMLTQGDPSEDAYAFLRITCEEIIEQELLRPEFRDADELAQMMWASMHGLVSLQIVKRHDAWVEWRDIRTTAGHMCDALLRGIQREPKPEAKPRRRPARRRAGHA